MTSGLEVTATTKGMFLAPIRFVADTSGAIPATFVRARGIASIAKGTHTIVITLARGYTALVDWFHPHVIQATPASTGSSGAWLAKVTAEDVATNKTITVSFFAPDGTAVDMATGDIFIFTPLLKKSPGLA